MSTLALEIHDAGIVTVDESGETGPASPGYALYDGDDLLTGLGAVHRARLKPRWVHRRFWEELDTTPLPRPFPRGLSPADLAHSHLEEVWGAAKDGVERVLLAIPGCFTDRQLGLILGIARACGLPVEGMVDSAVAAAANVACRGGKLLHLDLHLHRFVLTELLAETSSGDGGGRISRKRIEVSGEVGLVALQDAWARRIAELFIHTTRFDPLHSAASEQTLYRGLPEWLAQLRREESLEITLGDRRAIELTRADVVSAADPFYEHVLSLVRSLKRAGEPVILLVSHRLAELPGFEDRLAELSDSDRISLPPTAAAAGALAAADALGSASEALPFVTELAVCPPPPLEDEGPHLSPFGGTRPAQTPAAPAATPPKIEPPRSAERLPTHLLHGDLAVAITSEPLFVGFAPPDGKRGLKLADRPAGVSRSHCTIALRDGRVVVEDHSTYGAHRNGERIEGTASLAVGDLLRLGSPGIELRLIAVVEAMVEPGKEPLGTA